jgi:hypothetical protein
MDDEPLTLKISSPFMSPRNRFNLQLSLINEFFCHVPALICS